MPLKNDVLLKSRRGDFEKKRIAGIGAFDGAIKNE